MTTQTQWILFIDLGSPAPDFADDEYSRQFAFFDRLDNRFVEFNGDQAWSSWGEFESDLRSCSTLPDFPYRTKLTNETVDEFKSLCPNWVKEK